MFQRSHQRLQPIVAYAIVLQFLQELACFVEILQSGTNQLAHSKRMLHRTHGI